MKSDFLYVLFNKPYGVLTQFTDTEGRPTLKDFIPFEKIYAVGRLDKDSEGLLFLTNDGPLNHLFSSPDFKQPKTYWAQVEGIPSEKQMSELQREMRLSDYTTKPARVKVLEKEPELWPRPVPVRFRKSVPTSWLEITLYEGKNHQVRKMTAAVGLPCLRLVRIRIGTLELENLKPGEYRLIQMPEPEIKNIEMENRKNFVSARSSASGRSNDKFSRRKNRYKVHFDSPRQKKKY